MERTRLSGDHAVDIKMGTRIEPYDGNDDTAAALARELIGFMQRTIANHNNPVDRQRAMSASPTKISLFGRAPPRTPCTIAQQMARTMYAIIADMLRDRLTAQNVPVTLQVHADERAVAAYRSLSTCDDFAITVADPIAFLIPLFQKDDGLDSPSVSKVLVICARHLWLTFVNFNTVIGGIMKVPMLHFNLTVPGADCRNERFSFRSGSSNVKYWEKPDGTRQFGFHDAIAFSLIRVCVNTIWQACARKLAKQKGFAFAIQTKPWFDAIGTFATSSSADPLLKEAMLNAALASAGIATAPERAIIFAALAVAKLLLERMVIVHEDVHVPLSITNPTAKEITRCVEKFKSHAFLSSSPTPMRSIITSAIDKVWTHFVDLSQGVKEGRKVPVVPEFEDFAILIGEHTQSFIPNMTFSIRTPPMSPPPPPPTPSKIVIAAPPSETVTTAAQASSSNACAHPTILFYEADRLHPFLIRSHDGKAVYKNADMLAKMGIDPADNAVWAPNSNYDAFIKHRNLTIPIRVGFKHALFSVERSTIIMNGQEFTCRDFSNKNNNRIKIEGAKESLKEWCLRHNLKMTPTQRCVLNMQSCTPSLIDLSDVAVEELEKELDAEALEKELENERVLKLEAQLKERTDRVLELEAQLKERTDRILELEAQLKERTDHRTAELQAELAKRDHRIFELEHTIDGIERMCKRTKTA
jgi:hypothetical protein